MVEFLASRVPIMLWGGLVCICLSLGFLLIVRERFHRRRVKALLLRLGELENLWTKTAEESPQQKDSGVTDSSMVKLEQQPTFRGRLSTAISSLWKRARVDASTSERLDVRAIQLLYSDLSSSITPQQLASQLNTSLRTLQRHLATNLRCSPGDLIVAVKMREAKHRLISGAWQVQEVARSVGFENSFHFSKRFRAYYGVPPSQIRELAA